MEKAEEGEQGALSGMGNGMVVYRKCKKIMKSLNKIPVSDRINKIV